MANIYLWAEHAEDILNISKNQKVDNSVAYDMFRTDVRLGKAYDYNSNMMDYDFGPVHAEYEAIVEAKLLTCTSLTYRAFRKFCGKKFILGSDFAALLEEFKATYEPDMTLDDADDEE